MDQCIGKGFLITDDPCRTLKARWTRCIYKPDAAKQTWTRWTDVGFRRGSEREDGCLFLHHRCYKQLEAHADVQALPNRCSSPCVADNHSEARTAASSPDENISLWQSVKISGGVLAWPLCLFHIIYWEKRPAGQVYDASSDETWMKLFLLPAEKSRGRCEAQSTC